MPLFAHCHNHIQVFVRQAKGIADLKKEIRKRFFFFFLSSD
jgi:hypothetical protein